MSKTNTIVILRHSESEFNKQNLFCGWHDSPLSEKGLHDAHNIAAASLLSNHLEFDRIYTSVLKRANETVEVILQQLHCALLPVSHDWRLNERHYGNLTGFNKRQMADKYGEEQVQKWRRSYATRPPEINPENPYYNGIMKNPCLREVPQDKFPLAESMLDTYERVMPAWMEIKKEVLSGRHILIVAHGTVARCLAKQIQSISDEDIDKLNLPNSIPFIYEFDCDTGELVGSVKFLADEKFVKEEMKKVASIGK